MPTAGDEAYLERAIGRYSPEVAATARAALVKLRARFPGARQLVYERRQSLPIGFAPAERGAAIFSLVLYPRWVRFFFLEGVAIDDPEHRLEGAGSQVRSIRLDEQAQILDDRYIRGLMTQAFDGDRRRFDERPLADCAEVEARRAGRRKRDMFQTAIPVIQVSASGAAEEFYCKGLGFTLLTSWRPDETRDDPRYMTFAREGARLHVHSFQSGTTGAAAVYVFLDNVDALYAQLRANGVEVSGPPIDQTWGTREIVVRDPDRNVLTFGQRRLAS